MLDIVTVPNPILNTIVKPVAQIDDKIRRLVKNMGKTLMAQKDPEGVGLAAPQVGLSLSLFIIKPKKGSKIEAFINPRILKTLDEARKKPPRTKKKKGVPLEGCLSIPRIWGPIKRAKKILLEYQDLEGTKKTEWFSGFKAVIIAHEIDHLQGILFTQRAIEQKHQLYEEENGELVKVDY